MNAYDDLPEGYRPCAGAAVFNAEGCVFVGCRVDQDPDGDFAWQMPQGGLNKGENPERAARRELQEETGIRSISLLAETDGWLVYDFPPEVLGKRFKKYRGQAQKWYAYGFTGSVEEIDLAHHGEPEFQQWDWVPLKRVPALIVPFKRNVYEAIVTAFQPVAGGWKGTRG